MGWMHQQRQSLHKQKHTAAEPHLHDAKQTIVPSTIFIEDTTDPNSYQHVPIEMPNDGLPVIAPSIISASKAKNLLWIVIDDVVYDCTRFASEHPGGSDVLEPFQASDCSWQFWRFHRKEDMLGFGKALRIGVTKGVQNKYKERPRFIGLRGFWGQD
ncbi:hypothetical protein B0J13DRAFT_574008 [Dactylonectria estremocensis]|uniref:Cytochrome b5 heme-binding domain-containing protein n=1 Tax=Dactylonectria estremocensis TaxID=1079267 RepID=A0A9P9IAB3_9HYPO|nr:hypothetical protein B0J13DRAFT_574008 [Dactylonectria estremocensis]